MRVVLTRPEISAARTAARLVSLGHQPVLLPLTQARHLPDAITTAMAADHRVLIATSAETFRALKAAHAPLRLNSLVYAVGEATAAAAHAYGFTDVKTGPGSGEALADLIAAEQAGTARPLVYLAGRPRSPALEESLTLSRVPFETVTVYEMLPLAYGGQEIRDALLSPPADTVLLYSREAARLFCAIAASAVQECPHLRLLCLSRNVADAIPDNLRKRAGVAETPDEEGLLALLG